MANDQHPIDEPELPAALNDALDRGLARAFAEPKSMGWSHDSHSVLHRVVGITGARPSVSLREVDSSSHAPVLKPLTSSDGIAQQTGKYMVQGLLGQGGVGSVHKGHDTDLGRDVAIKFLHERYKNEPAVLHRFIEEAQIGGQLQHPGIVPVHELGISDGRPFFTMKMVRGQTLAKKLAGRSSPTVDRRAFLSIFEQICQTMAYAHARGVVHRDLKPANAMIGSFGEVQVVDWGMGKVLRSGGLADENAAAKRHSQLGVLETLRSASQGTQSIMGSVMGTPAYMPPEQARGDVDQMDERSDVFALGAILCEILTGQPPYVGEPKELIDRAATADLDDAHARIAASGADNDLIELASGCLSAVPADRPQSAERVAEAVCAHLAAAEQRVHEATLRALTLKRTQRLGMLLTAVIVVGLAASLWFWSESQRAAQGERNARVLADSRAAQTAVARDAAESNLANFNHLSQVVRLEAARAKEAELFPAWPARSEAMRTWLDTDAKSLLGALPDLHDTLADLETGAVPRSAEESAKARRTHPRSEELRRLVRKLAALQKAEDVRQGGRRPRPFVLDEASLPASSRELNSIAWTLVDPDREEFGREAEGLALARRALSTASENGDQRAEIGDTLAWALFANGLDEDALTTSREALEAASAARKAEFSVYLERLETAIAAEKGVRGRRAIAELSDEVAALDAEISFSTGWRLDDDADQFLHATLSKLITEIEAFERAEVARVHQQLLWSEHVEELTIGRYAERWRDARLAILKADGRTASTLYGEHPLELTPQMGLVPLGMNPVTLLWEFYHLRSAWDSHSDPAEIEIPCHREDGSIRVTGDTGIVFVLLPGSTFWMGAQTRDPNGRNYDRLAESDEKLREVAVQPFFLARHELTQGQWARLWPGDAELRHPSHCGIGFRASGMTSSVDASHPVEQVDWAMSRQTMVRHGLSLPNETQWEYGCRGMTTTPHWPDYADLKLFANLADATAKSAGVPWTCDAWSDGHVVHAPVGSFGANPFGLHDVHGNVWEWCQDEYASGRIYRGGSFDGPAVNARSAQRGGYATSIRLGNLGLRAARSVTR